MTYRNHFHWVKISELYITYVKFIKVIHINYKIITKIHLEIQYTLNNFFNRISNWRKNFPNIKSLEKNSPKNLFI